MRNGSFIFFFLFLVNSFAQIESTDYLSLDKENESIENYVTYYIDATRTLSFEEVRRMNFHSMVIPPSEEQAITWYKFHLSPKIKSKYLVLSPHIVDKSDVFVPYKKDYKKFEVGTLSNRRIKHDYIDAVVLYIPLDSIDFSKAFYYNKIILTELGKTYSRGAGIATLADNTTSWTYKNFVEESYAPGAQRYLVVIFISFLLFFVNFLVTNDKNFLNYSLYLLFTSAIFISEVPFLYNNLLAIHPFSLSIIKKLSIIMTSTSYFYFVIYFVGVKNKFPRIYKIAKYTIICLLLYGVFVLFQMILFPYFPYRYLLSNFFKVAFLVISIVVFVFLMINRLSLPKRIVVIGSMFLIVGQILSVVLGYSFYFFGAVVIEIIIFSGVVSYQNRVVYNKQVKGKMKLKNEKIKRENLLEMDLLKSKFFSNISHEFRTPLTLISGPIQKQLSKSGLPEEERNNLEMMQRNTDRLLSLVNQLLDLAKIESGKAVLRISKSDIISFVEKLVENFAFAAKQRQIELQVEVQSTNVDTWFDKDNVEKIVVNLLSNAVKYTPEKGVIRCISYVKDEQFFIEIGNTGNELSREELDKIFERFYQVDQFKQGTGIGLSLVQEIVKFHKGSISVGSSKHWTQFKVILPISKKDYEELLFVETSKDINPEILAQEIDIPIHSTDDVVEVNKDKPILLIVEDNVDVRTYVGEIFTNNYSILEAPNGRKGIELAIEYIPDIIISDIMMPVTDGIELCNILKVDERTSHIPIVILTAKAGDGNKIIGIETGADDYITKPFNAELLALKVKKLIELRKKLQERYSQDVVLKPKDITINPTEVLFLERLQAVLDSNLIESSFSNEEFCRAVAMSRMQLHRKLKALFGMSTSEFIRSQRLKLAATLLKSSDANISDICYSVGFNDPAYFSKCFKEVYHCTPSEYLDQS